jgi:hypothetical protein
MHEDIAHSRISPAGTLIIVIRSTKKVTGSGVLLPISAIERGRRVFYEFRYG